MGINAVNLGTVVGLVNPKDVSAYEPWVSVTRARACSLCTTTLLCPVSLHWFIEASLACGGQVPVFDMKTQMVRDIEAAHKSAAAGSTADAHEELEEAGGSAFLQEEVRASAYCH